MDQGSPSKSIFTRERRIESLHKLEAIFASFSITEKVAFLIAAGIFALGTLSIIHQISETFVVEIPTRGGQLTEGIIGTPRFINPLLATSDADKDLSALVYSGLLKMTSTGELVPDLAERYEVSEDGLTYSFVLRTDAVFHDGTPVTTDDIEFTILKTQDGTLKSPRQASWDGVTVQKTGTHEISLVLKKAYAPFSANLTLGILPKHIWQTFQSDQFPFSSYNIEPIGSGPYKITSVRKSNQGIPTSIKLRANKSYALGEPYITDISFSFYPNDKALEDALASNEIESGSNLNPSSAQALSETTRIVEAPLTRIFGIFFNQNNKEILAHRDLRRALDLSIDKQEIIDNVLLGYGSVATEALPPAPTAQPTDASGTSTLSANLEQAKSLFSKEGWTMNSDTGVLESRPKSGATTTLSFSLSTANIPELVEAAGHIKEDWASVGVDADVKIFESSDLNQTVIRPRKYEALLFGMVTGANPDLYAFWHSSQRNDPGLNIALYTNAKADRFLEGMRQAADPTVLSDQYEQFAKEIEADSPAVFLWSPNFIYAIPEKVQGVGLSQITNPSDRFLDIEKWYISTDRVWTIFNTDTN